MTDKLNHSNENLCTGGFIPPNSIPTKLQIAQGVFCGNGDDDDDNEDNICNYIDDEVNGGEENTHNALVTDNDDN